jgi:hypothetical protein
VIGSWVDAGAKGVAVGLSHVVRSQWQFANAVLTLYMILQALFAPVGAAGTRSGAKGRKGQFGPGLQSTLACSI